jgi:hypothetical protein
MGPGRGSLVFSYGARIRSTEGGRGQEGEWSWARISFFVAFLLLFMLTNYIHEVINFSFIISYYINIPL